MGTYWVCRTSLRTASEMRVALFLLQRRSLSLREAAPSALGHTAKLWAQIQTRLLWFLNLCSFVLMFQDTDPQNRNSMVKYTYPYVPMSRDIHTVRSRRGCLFYNDIKHRSSTGSSARKTNTCKMLKLDSTQRHTDQVIHLRTLSQSVRVQGREGTNIDTKGLWQ